MFILGMSILQLIPRLTGFTTDQVAHVSETSSYALIKTALLSNAFISLVIFMLPALLFAYFAHPQPLPYIGLRMPGKTTQPLLAILLMLGAIPALELIQYLVSLLPFSAATRASQAANDSMMNSFLNVSTGKDLIFAFTILAIVPGVSEELFFRGILMRLTAQKTQGIAFPIFFTAIIFASAHGNMFGLPSIFAAGILLGFIYYITGSLWCSILGHLSFNGANVVLSYLGNTSSAVKNTMNNSGAMTAIIVGGTIVACASFFALLKYKSPLPANWTDDFDGKQEIADSEIF